MARENAGHHWRRVACQPCTVAACRHRNAAMVDILRPRLFQLATVNPISPGARAKGGLPSVARPAKNRERRMVDQTVASWNRIVIWFRLLIDWGSGLVGRTPKRRGATSASNGASVTLSACHVSPRRTTTLHSVECAAVAERRQPERCEPCIESRSSSS